MLFGREDLDEASEEEDLPRTSKRKLLDHCIPDEEYRKDIKDNDDNWLLHGGKREPRKNC